MRVDLGLSGPLPAPGGATLTERPGRLFSAILERPNDAGKAASAGARPATALAAVLARTADADRAVDGLMAAAASGRTFTPAQLLALQSTVCRASQAVEVMSRVVDRLAGAVKQSLGTQI